MLIHLLMSAMKRWVPLRREKLIRAVLSLSRLGFSPIARTRVGPMTLELDVSDEFQRNMFFGTYEDTTFPLMRRVLRAGDTYVDVGAQLGYMAAKAASLIGETGRMVLIEPDPVALAKLERHLASGYGQPGMPQVDLARGGCSDRAASLRFHVSPTLGHSRVLSDGDSPEDGSVVTVPVDTLDSTLEGLDVDAVRFLKIDIEGHEIDALLGAQKTLASGLVETVLIEKNLDYFLLAERDVAIFHALIAMHGFRAIQDTTPRWVDDQELLNLENSLENYFFVRDPAMLDGMDLDPPGSLDMEKVTALGQMAVDGRLLESEARSIVRVACWQDLNEAAERGERLIQANPTLDWFRGHLAWWHEGLGQFAEALVHYEFLAASQPQNASVAERIREVRSRLGADSSQK